MITINLPSSMDSALEALRLTPEQALTRFLTTELTQKLHEYRRRCEKYEQQYGISYQEFCDRIANAPIEDFAQSDDRNAWQFALEAESVIRERLQELQ